MKRATEKLGLYSGLYDNGIVSIISVGPQVGFVPYHLIEEIKESRVNVNRMMMLKLKGFKRPIAYDLKGLLGEEGIQMLYYILHKGPEPHGPPELYIYGGRGSRVRSIPKGPSNDGSKD